MDLVQEIRSAYQNLDEKLNAHYEREFLLEMLKEEVVAEHFEELRGARSNDARNQLIAAFMQGGQEYEKAKEAATEARKEFEAAKYRVEMMRLIASVQGAGSE